MACLDPLRLSTRVESEVYEPHRQARKYWRIRASRHYGGNVAGDVVGCNLRCAFCWAWRYAFDTRPGFYLAPREAASRIARAGPYRLARLTGGEPTIGWPHTRALAGILIGRGYEFVLETNGLLIGSGRVDPGEIPRGVFVRVSIKAPSREYFERVTGACGWAWDLQVRALERLLEAGFEPGLDFRAAVVLGVAPEREYSSLFERLAGIDERLVETVEPEYIVLYRHVVELMSRRGFKPYLAVTPDGRVVRRGWG